MRFIVISEKDEVLRISHAVMSELFDRKLALPQFAQKRIRWCEVVVSLKEGRAVAVQRVLARYIHFDAHGLLDLDRQLEEARLRMDVSSADITAEDLSPEEQLVREAKAWLDRQVIAQECEWEPDHDLRLVIENVALDPRPRLWLDQRCAKHKDPERGLTRVPPSVTPSGRTADHLRVGGVKRLPKIDFPVYPLYVH
jgi:hypothetical protein